MPDWYSSLDPKDLGRARAKLNEQIAEKLADGCGRNDSNIMELIERRDKIHAAIPNRVVGFGGAA